MWDAEEHLLDKDGFIDRYKSKEKYFWWDEGQTLRSGWANLTIINRRWKPWERGRRNNIIHRGDDTWGAHGSAVTLDPTDTLARRYKMAFDCHGLLPCIAVSADGLYFESLHNETPVLPIENLGKRRCKCVMCAWIHLEHDLEHDLDLETLEPSSSCRYPLWRYI